MQTTDYPYVRFKNVQKSYDGETLVVKDLNLDIAAGEFVTMLGPSGSGKFEDIIVFVDVLMVFKYF